MQYGSGLYGGVDDGVWDLRDQYSIIASATHPMAQKLIEFWDARPTDGIVLGRDVPSRSIANILSNVAIYEPLDEGRDFKVRLAGASIQRRFGGDVKSMLLSELFSPEDFRHHVDALRTVVEKDMALVIDSHLTNGTVESMHLEVVLLPVWLADRTHKCVLAGLFFFN